MGNLKTIEVEKYLSEKLEGKLFVDISMNKIFGKTFSVSKDFYTVKNGKVCMVNDGKEQFTNDELINLKSDCRQIGIYHPEKVYKKILKYYTYSEFKKLHKL